METKSCPFCGEEIVSAAKKCKHCGEWLNSEKMQGGQQIVINQVAPAQKQSNGIGTAGFVVALCAAVFCWAPGLGWILWALGLILSFVGVFRNPKGLAIAGLGISSITLILLIALIATAATIINALF